MAEPRTLKEIQAMIKRLEREKQSSPEYSFFGDNNWKSYEECIDVLRGRWADEDEIYDEADNLEDASTLVNVLDWMNGEDTADEFIDPEENEPQASGG